MFALFAPTALAQDLLEPAAADVDRPGAIIHGDPATVDDWPMAGALLVGGTATFEGRDPIESRALRCSSTLIAPDVVLIAAHCVDPDVLASSAEVDDDTLVSYDQVQLAFSREQDLSRFDDDAQEEGDLPDWPDDVSFASSSVSHPDFDAYDLQFGLGENDDLALLFLEEPLEGVPLAVLPTEEEAEQLELGREVEIVGWGQQDEDSDPGEYGEKRMATSFVAALGTFEMQIGEASSDSRKCHGDSGGPTFVRVETDSADPWRLAGLSSHAWDESECDDAGGVDTRIDPHLAWIDEQLRAGCDDGTRSWCEEPGILPAPDEDGAGVEVADAAAVRPVACGCSGTSLAPSWAVGFVALAVARRRRA